MRPTSSHSPSSTAVVSLPEVVDTVGVDSPEVAASTRSMSTDLNEAVVDTELMSNVVPPRPGGPAAVVNIMVAEEHRANEGVDVDKRQLVGR